ncbi:hypothetical protein BC834DRAFT_275613 [Gloeopeniophorella convolvens]|nr:hypothetical protein BC834DRAFT_275613 [Gloeopeniophorella convolvens]
MVRRVHRDSITRRGSDTPGDALQREHASHLQGQPEADKGYSDGSGALFSIYLDRAEEEDKRLAESWKGDADGILVFTGLFSAAVATFIGVSYQNLQLNSQDASAFYLARLYQQSSPVNHSLPTLPPTISDPSTFSPSKSAVWINVLWFLSLVISLTCALLATLLQQWVRRYLRLTQTRYQPHKRARIRAFFSEGVEKCRLPQVVEALPALLHISVFLFYTGLIIFSSTLNHIVFCAVLVWVALCVSLYFVITVMPTIRRDSPYQTPLSTLVWYCSLGLLLVVRGVAEFAAYHLGVFKYETWQSIRDVQTHTRQRLVQGTDKEAEEVAMRQPHAIDARALAWAFDSLDEDHELEQFAAGIPGFYNSATFGDPGIIVNGMNALSHRGPILHEIIWLMHRSMRSVFLSEEKRKRRLEITFKAAFCISATWFLPEVPRPRQLSLRLYTVELCGVGDDLSRAEDQDVALSSQCVAALCVTRASAENDLWYPVLQRRFDISPARLHEYFNHGNSLLFANIIHFLQHAVLPNLGGTAHIPYAPMLEGTLSYLCSFEYNDTLPELRQQFCALWSRLTDPSDISNGRSSRSIVLTCLLPLHDALHSSKHTTPQDSSPQTCSVCSDPAGFSAGRPLKGVDDPAASLPRRSTTAPVSSSMTTPPAHDAVAHPNRTETGSPQMAPRAPPASATGVLMYPSGPLSEPIQRQPPSRSFDDPPGKKSQSHPSSLAGIPSIAGESYEPPPGAESEARTVAGTSSDFVNDSTHGLGVDTKSPLHYSPEKL